MSRDFEKTIDLFDRLQWDTTEEEYNRIFGLIEKDYISGDDIRRKQILELAYKEVLSHSLALYWYLGPAYQQGKEGESESVHNFIRESLRAHEVFYKLLSRREIAISQFCGSSFVGESFTVNINPASLLRFANSKTTRTLSDFRDTIFIDPATPIKEKSGFLVSSGIQAVDDLIYTVKFKIAILSNALTEISKGQDDERLNGLCRSIKKAINGLIGDFDSLERDFIIFRVKEREEESGNLPELPRVVSPVEEEGNPTILSQVKTAFYRDIQGLLGAMLELFRIKAQKPETEKEIGDQLWVICEALRSKVDDFGGLFDEYLKTQPAAEIPQDVADNIDK